VTDQTVRRVLLVTHVGRDDARELAREIALELSAAGIEVCALEAEARSVGAPEIEPVSAPHAAQGCELVVVLGGDGTVLRSAELARAFDVPLLGVNLGHVGFLAEAEVDDKGSVVACIVDRAWTVEERTTLEVVVRVDGVETERSWALNEASVEKASRERMLEVLVEVDGRPLSRWGCDGVVAATPTGSTAYAFSAGGPVVWPEVEAMLVVPISAHALFSRPLVVSPHSTIAVDVLGSNNAGAVMWCDGRRSVELTAGSRVEVTRHSQPVRFARVHSAPFTDRLVAKFELPVDGWGVQRRRAGGAK